MLTINGQKVHAIWMEDTMEVKMVHQNELPHREIIFTCSNYRDTIIAIKDMIVRGAGTIGLAGGFAMAQAFWETEKKQLSEGFIRNAKKEIELSRPTAQNLFYATQKVYEAGIKNGTRAAIEQAQLLAEEDILLTEKIGMYGNELLKDGYKILTHCNAGRLAFIGKGTALAPVYTAALLNKNPFVFVNETRPRSQGARLTAWELQNQKISFTVITDNAAAYYMSKNEINIVITGADRISQNGDTANKIGTLEKAICAKYFNIPFYIAAPTTTIDINCLNGNQIPIEERCPDEVLWQTGPTKYGDIHTILVAAPKSTAFNPAFDITRAELITGIITEHGIIKPNKDNILNLLSKK